MNPLFIQRPYRVIFYEIQQLYETRGLRHFACYDDALFSNQKKYIEPLPELIIDSGLNLICHCPDGLFAKMITARVKAGQNLLCPGLACPGVTKWRWSKNARDFFLGCKSMVSGAINHGRVSTPFQGELLYPYSALGLENRFEAVNSENVFNKKGLEVENKSATV